VIVVCKNKTSGLILKLPAIASCLDEDKISFHPMMQGDKFV